MLNRSGMVDKEGGGEGALEMMLTNLQIGLANGINGHFRFLTSGSCPLTLMSINTGLPLTALEGVIP